MWLDGDRQRREIVVSQVPGRTDRGLKERRDGTSKGVAVCLCFPAIREISRGRYQGAPFGVPPPSFLIEGGSLNPPFTRRDLRAAMTLARRKERCEMRERAPRTASYAGSTRLRGRSPFGEAKARVSITLHVKHLSKRMDCRVK